MARTISPERKSLYMLGWVVSGVGLVLFLSNFFVVGGVGVPGASSSMSGMAVRSVVGILLVAAGGGMRRVAARGVAGSGLVLDPERARGELEPWSRMAGGMVGDALDEADVDLGRRASEPERVVMIKCGACGKLNEEDSKFCQECGRAL